MNKAAATEALNLYGAIERDQKTLLALRRTDYGRVAIQIKLSGHDRRGSSWGEIETPMLDMNVSSVSGLAEQIANFARSGAIAAAEARIAERQRRLAQLGFQKAETGVTP